MISTPRCNSTSTRCTPMPGSGEDRGHGPTQGRPTGDRAADPRTFRPAGDGLAPAGRRTGSGRGRNRGQCGRSGGRSGARGVGCAGPDRRAGRYARRVERAWRPVAQLGGDLVGPCQAADGRRPAASGNARPAGRRVAGAGGLLGRRTCRGHGADPVRGAGTCRWRTAWRNRTWYWIPTARPWSPMARSILGATGSTSP
jgi:hypothetical protein